MKTKTKLILFGVQIILLFSVQFLLSTYDSTLIFYNHYIYFPFQSARGYIFNFIPFSIGDIVYILAGIGLVITLTRWVYFISKFRVHKYRLGGSVLNALNTIAFVLLFFILGWGANYYKTPLSENWRLPRKISRKEDSINLVAFDRLLVNRINANAPLYKNMSFKEVNSLSLAWYRVFTDSKLKENGLGIKPTLFAYFLEHIGIDGYYNPFTGEGQINTSLPAFILPFVICHEIAHQAGVAAEDDANLMAYSIGSISNNPTFIYSASLNIWLYVNSRLYRRDTGIAKKLEAQLNP